MQCTVTDDGGGWWFNFCAAGAPLGIVRLLWEKSDCIGDNRSHTDVNHYDIYSLSQLSKDSALCIWFFFFFFKDDT